ncbi:putative ATP-binding protein involved in virulence [Erwinia sp. JUb26]|nr:putative ATP-binding protein involved in virulence [Erwinia sp. JUb26]
MYIKSIQIDNYGAIEKLSLDLPFNEDGTPKPMILVGKNGSGKTLLTSSIVDSLIEIKRSNFQSIAEAKERSYYKAGKKDYIKQGENYSYIRVIYENVDDNKKRVVYNDVASYSAIETRDLLQHYNINLAHDFNDHGFSKTIEGESKNIFTHNAILYFPVNRYYNPAWLVEDYDPRIEIIENFLGKNTDNFIKINAIKEIESWILDVILDSELYERKIIPVQPFILADGQYIAFPGTLTIPKEGKNTKIQVLINQVLTTILKSKIPNLVSARFGISSKDVGRKISVIIKEHDSTEEKSISPTFSHMSSGEAMLVALFCSIIKKFDSVSGVNNFDLNQIKGIVIIDEVDLNLHIGYAKNAVPELLKLFSKVQFIITSHSPFFLLGMKDTFGSNYQIVSTPGGEIIDETDFEELQTAYSIFVERFEDIKENLSILENELYNSTKTLVITEGKTDWKHLKTALSSFQNIGEFTDLDVVFHEYEDASFSDDKLNNFLINIAQVSNNKKIIGIFDRDEGNGKKYSRNKINELGNNVYAITIPQPEHRSYHDGICIEFMYKDEDLFRENESGRRLYVSSQFNDNGRLIQDIQVGVQNHNKIRGKNNLKNDNIVDSEVINIEGESLAMSKNDYANAILGQEEKFKDLDFSAFRELFSTLIEVINK